MAGTPKIVLHIQDLLTARNRGAWSDGDLLQRYLLHGDDDSFAVLVGRHGPLVLKLKALATVLAGFFLIGAGGLTLYAMPRPASMLAAVGEAVAEPAKDALPVAPRKVAVLATDWAMNVAPESKEDRQWVEAAIDKGLDALARRGRPALPGFAPLAANGRILLRTYNGFHAIDLKAKDPQERNSWSFTDGGVRGLLGDWTKRPAIDEWQAKFEREGPLGLLFDNALTGTLASEGVRTYLVDDLLIPPPPARPGFRFIASLDSQAKGNMLKAYNLESTKLLWDLGGKDKTGHPALDALKESFFLGAPLPLDGKLYVLNEQGQQIRLLCLTAKDKDERVPPPPEVNWQLDLVKATEGFGGCIGRRTRAAQPLAAGDLLLCPSNAGALVAVDVSKQKVAWKYPYRAAAPEADMVEGWKSAPPFVADGKVVFTAPDDNTLHCVHLKTGEMVWKVERGEDLYLAGVFGERVLLVGPKGCRALNLADGKQAWRGDVGIPSGRGTAVSDSCYLLPLQVGGQTLAPEICVLHPLTGKVIGHVLAKPGDVPGNLALDGSRLLSQSPSGLTAYKMFDLVALIRAAVPPPREQDALWLDLGAATSPTRNTALLGLAWTGDQGVRYLATRLKPAGAGGPAVTQAIENLSDQNPAVRQKATKELEEAGEIAETKLRAALAQKPGLDLTRRLQDLLARIDKMRTAPPPETLRVIDGVVVLERIASDDARRLLDLLAKGNPDAILTERAAAAIERLQPPKGR